MTGSRFSGLALLLVFGCSEAVPGRPRAEVLTENGGAAGETGLAAETTVELCNFVDDDSDGEVDEGFDWVYEHHGQAFVLDLYPSYLHPVTLPNGMVVVVGVSSYGGNHDQGFLALFDGEGELVEPPSMTDIPNVGGNMTGVCVQPGTFSIGALYSSTDYAGCTSSCPMTLAEFTATETGLVRDETTLLDLPFVARQGDGIVCTGDGFVTTIIGDDGHGHLTWIDAETKGVTRDLTLSPENVYSTALALFDSRLVWMSERSYDAENWIGTSLVQYGILDVTTGDQLAYPTNLGSGNLSGPNGGGRPIAQSGDNILLGWTHWTNQSDFEPAITLVRPTETTRNTTHFLRLDNAALTDILTLEGNPVTLSLVADGSVAQIGRFRRDLTELDTPSGPLVFTPDSGGLSFTRVEKGLLVVRAWSEKAVVRDVHTGLIKCKKE